MRSLPIVLALLVCARGAHAQTTPAAEALFAEGKRLMEEGRVAEGCAKLDESVRLEPAGGAMMNLALCWEKAGRNASAWAAFRAALERAKRDGRADRVEEAERRIAALEPRLARVRVVAESMSAGGTIMLDDATLGSASWSSAIPVDAGEHRIEARAPGHRTWSTTVRVVDGSETRIEVPALVREEAVAPALAARPVEPSRGGRSPLTTPVIIAGGVALTAIAVGSVFGIVAANKHDESGCSSSGCPNAAAGALNDEARTAAWGSNIGFAVGAVAIVTMVYLIATGGGREP